MVKFAWKIRKMAYRKGGLARGGFNGLTNQKLQGGEVG